MQELNQQTIKKIFLKIKKIVKVKPLKLIVQYNQHMGGTDQMNQNVGTQKIEAKGQKWWQPHFT